MGNQDSTGKPAANPTKKPGAPSGGPSNHSSGGQKSAPGKIGCAAVGCHEKDKKYNFCVEHFRQFKFGLITKKGDPVSDYEKKLEHYQKWLSAQKVA